MSHHTARTCRIRHVPRESLAVKTESLRTDGSEALRRLPGACPEKWTPVFRRGHAPIKELEHIPVHRNRMCLDDVAQDLVEKAKLGIGEAQDRINKAKSGADTGVGKA